jgi:hypothetical protein
MRHRKRDLVAPVKSNLTLRFTGEGLTSYAGLELFRQFLHGLGFSGRLRRHLRAADPAGDFSSVGVVRLLLAMFVVGARRLRHVRYLVEDPLILRFCGLRSLPSERTLSRWLSRCTVAVRSALQALNAEILFDTVRGLGLRRLTVDVDGTVVSTGLQVERAFRGFNPHHRKVPSYYPITAFLAQTAQFLRVQNRSGNVHDGKASLPFLRDLFAQLRLLAPKTLIEMRLDGAFFRRDILAFLETRAQYAIRVPFYHWIDLQSHIRSRRRWKRIRKDLYAFEAHLYLAPWHRIVRVAIYRKRVSHKTRKNYQLDLFDPSNGSWEYSAIATNKDLGLKALWDFLAGRGAHEKALAELKNGFAFDTVPTQTYAANSAWQILSTLAYNLVASFQIQTGAPKRKKSPKRTCLFTLKSIATLRYELLGRAGIVQYPNGRATLTLSQNLPARQLFERLGVTLARAA